MKLEVKCKCGEPISISQAAKVMALNRKNKLTSNEAKKIRKKRTNYPKKHEPSPIATRRTKTQKTI